MQSNQLTVSPVLMGRDRSLFGMLTRPTQQEAHLGAIIFNAGLLHNVGPFRLHVDLAEELARIGIPSLRIDQSGKGDSPPRDGMSRQESILADYHECVSHISQYGTHKHILIGLCSGADDALDIASRADGVVGIVMLDGYAKKTLSFYFRKYGAKILSWRSWRNVLNRFLRMLALAGTDSAEAEDGLNIRNWSSDRQMLDKISSCLSNDIRILAIFTHGQDYYNHLNQLSKSIAGPERSRLKEIYFPDADHTYSRVNDRERLLSAISSGIAEHFDSGS